MIHRSITALALAACTFAPLAAHAASSMDNNANISQNKAPIVHVTLKNLSNSAQNLVIQGRPVTLNANASYRLDVPAGTQVFGADNTVKFTVIKEYNNSTASFR